MKKNLNEQVMRLTRQELIALIFDDFGFFFHLSQEHINRARAKVLRKKADNCFAEWEKLSESIRSMLVTSIDDQISYFQARKNAEKMYKRYERYWSRADRLEFGKN